MATRRRIAVWLIVVVGRLDSGAEVRPETHVLGCVRLNRGMLRLKVARCSSVYGAQLRLMSQKVTGQWLSPDLALGGVLHACFSTCHGMQHK